MSLLQGLAQFSPSSTMKQIAMTLAGTGSDREGLFMQAYWEQREAHGTWYRKTAAVGGWDTSDLPRFSYHEKAADPDLRPAGIQIGILALWSILLFASAFVVFLRYDVR